MNEWRASSLGEVTEVITKGTTPTTIGRAFVGSGIAFVKAESIDENGRLIEAKLAAIDETTHGLLARSQLYSGDILFSIAGVIGRTALIRANDVPANTNQALAIIRVDPSSNVDPAFLYYQMRSDRFLQHGLGRVVQTAQANLSLGMLRSAPIVVPLPAEQRAIVAVLQALDNLIENNRRRVEVLEEMARAIYREWFVHFRYPGHENDTLVDSSLGPIPEGWQVRTVAEASKVVTRGIAPKYAEDGPWTVLNQKCIRNNRVALDQARRQERNVAITKEVHFGDVLINSTGVGTLGRTALYLGDHPTLTADSHVTIVRPVDPLTNPWFGLSLISREPEFEALGTGSTGQTELRRRDVESLRVLFPERAILKSFGTSVWPLLTGIAPLLQQSKNLGVVRDLLLPKLVTGQIDVSSLDLDALIEGSVA